MTSDTQLWEILSSIFHDALAQPPEARAAFVKAATAAASAPDLEAEILAMLATAADDQPLEVERWLETTDAPIEVVGPWRILHRIGRGGMGDVYLAERLSAPFTQRVALKILRDGLVGDEARARFERERRILARLTHPSVVPLLDGGVAADGRPYLVMQLVEGVPLTQYLDDQQADIPRRLRLFIGVCRAVQHAHSRLVVHRDLKPSNILVTADGSLRLLDFGIARMIGDDDSPEAGLTRGMPAPMTPERAAPEQWRDEPPTTATDVWALGVLLFEILTGRLPFAAQPSFTALSAEVLKGDAPRPSRVVQTAGADPHDPDTALQARARVRQSTPAALARALRGDLDTIVARAMHVEPDRRYGSVGLLADDVAAFLDGRPVTAQGDSWRYRTTRFVARHRVPVASAAALTVALVVGAGSYVAQNVRIARERDRATAESIKARAVGDLMSNLLMGAGPAAGAGTDEISIARLLERGTERVETLHGHPEVQARLWHTLASIHTDRSEFERAGALLQKSLDATAHLPDTDPDRARVIIDYGRALSETLSRRDEGRALLEGLMAKLEGRPEAAPLLARALERLAAVVRGSDGRRLGERALALRQAQDPRDDEAVADCLNVLAEIAWFDEHDERRSRDLWRESVRLYESALGADDHKSVTARGNLAIVLETPAERVAMSRSVLDARIRMFGDDSTASGTAWVNLGVNLVKAGDLAGGEAALRRAQPTLERRFGEAHLESLSNLWNIARITELRGRIDEALDTFNRVTARLTAAKIDALTAATYEPGRARALRHAGRYAEADAVLQRVLPILERDVVALEMLADAHLELGRLAQVRGQSVAAIRHLRAAVAARERVARADHVELHEARAELGRVLVAAGQAAEGRPLLTAALPIYAAWSMADPADVRVLQDAR